MDRTGVGRMHKSLLWRSYWNYSLSVILLYLVSKKERKKERKRRKERKKERQKGKKERKKGKKEGLLYMYLVDRTGVGG